MKLQGTYVASPTAAVPLQHAIDRSKNNGGSWHPWYHTVSEWSWTQKDWGQGSAMYTIR